MTELNTFVDRVEDLADEPGIEPAPITHIPHSSTTEDQETPEGELRYYPYDTYDVDC